MSEGILTNEEINQLIDNLEADASYGQKDEIMSQKRITLGSSEDGSELYGFKKGGRVFITKRFGGEKPFLDSVLIVRLKKMERKTRSYLIKAQKKNGDFALISQVEKNSIKLCMAEWAGGKLCPSENIIAEYKSVGNFFKDGWRYAGCIEDQPKSKESKK